MSMRVDGGQNMWDYIIIGAGSAGCVAANRLSEDPRHRVLLIEAGGSADRLRFRIPALGPLAAIGQPDSDWMLFTEPDPSRNNRIDRMPRGKVMGGSSAINGTIYVRGNRGDYDHWAQLGCSGWDYEALLPYFRTIEGDRCGLSPSYGHDGPLRLSRTRGAHPLAQVFIEAMRELGVPENADYNGVDQAGASITHVNQRRGWRWSAARAFVDPIRSRKNLEILTGCMARRILIENGRAIGIEFEQGGEVRVERCVREVVLSASAYNSPKLLMLSGIGDPDRLTEHGITVAAALPGVGRNLQEHPNCAIKAYVSVPTHNVEMGRLAQMRHGLRFGLMGAGPASYVFPAISFVRLRPESEYPDLQFHFGAFAMDATPQGPRMLDRPAVTIQPNVNRSQSRGYVTLRSADPADPPAIQHNMLESRYDLDTLMAGVKLGRALLKTSAFAPYFQGEHVPGPQVDTDEALEAFIRANANPCYHSSGSLKMGIDAGAVVDPRLRVRGVTGLRVLDSSIIPQVPSGNINAISMVIGAKGADMILEDNRG